MEKIFPVNEGNLYENGAANEMLVAYVTGAEARVQAFGSGTCKVVGKLKPEGDFKPLSLVRLSDLEVVDTITDNNIYALDVKGIHSISVSNASGFTTVYAKVIV